MKNLMAGIPAGVPAFFVFIQMFHLSFKICLRLQKVEEKMKSPSF